MMLYLMGREGEGQNPGSVLKVNYCEDRRSRAGKGGRAVEGPLFGQVECPLNASEKKGTRLWGGGDFGSIWPQKNKELEGTNTVVISGGEKRRVKLKENVGSILGES